MTEQSITPALKKGISVISNMVQTLSISAGVYRMLDDNGMVLYVGKAKNLKNRVRSYTQPEKQSLRIQRMISRTTQMEVVEVATETDALLLEQDLIKTLKPYYNILLRDDKSYPEIELSFDRGYPFIKKHRGLHAKGNRYFGPFVSATAVNDTIRLLENVFFLGSKASRDNKQSEHKKRYLPVLKNKFSRNFAPDGLKLKDEEYDSYIDEVVAFLSGKNTNLRTRLQNKMIQASKSEDYETALAYRNRIQALSNLHISSGTSISGVGDADVFGIVRDGILICVQVLYFRMGQASGSAVYFPRCDDKDLSITLSDFIGQFYTEKPPPKNIYVSEDLKDITVLSEALKTRVHYPKGGVGKTVTKQAVENAKASCLRNKASLTKHMSALDELTQVLGLSDVPSRIEVYDNSHTGGTNPVGGMIVVGSDGFDKKSYRSWNIQTEMLTRSGDGVAGDDFAMMREVFSRRFNRAISMDSVLPDVIVVDGGKGQLSSALEILDSLNLSDLMVVSIAKGEKRNDGTETFYMRDRQVPIEVGTPLHHFMERIRDEAHRFAITKHRKRRDKANLKSPLDAIDGVGERRRKALMQAFGSSVSVGKASIEDLQKVDGISQNLAQKIYEYFKALN